MTIDSIYSKERGHRLSPLYTDRHYSFKCYQFAVQFKRQPHYFLPRSPPFSLFSSARRRGGHFYWPGPVANRFCNHAIREREDRCCEMRKKRCARSLRKIRMFLGLVDHSQLIRRMEFELVRFLFSFHAFINFVDPIISLVVSDESNMDSRWKQTIWWVLLKSILIYFIYMDD